MYTTPANVLVICTCTCICTCSFCFCALLTRNRFPALATLSLSKPSLVGCSDGLMRCRCLPARGCHRFRTSASTQFQQLLCKTSYGHYSLEVAVPYLKSSRAQTVGKIITSSLVHLIILLGFHFNSNSQKLKVIKVLLLTLYYSDCDTQKSGVK